MSDEAVEVEVRDYTTVKIRVPTKTVVRAIAVVASVIVGGWFWLKAKDKSDGEQVQTDS